MTWEFFSLAAENGCLISALYGHKEEFPLIFIDITPILLIFFGGHALFMTPLNIQTRPSKCLQCSFSLLCSSPDFPMIAHWHDVPEYPASSHQYTSVPSPCDRAWNLSARSCRILRVYFNFLLSFIYCVLCLRPFIMKIGDKCRFSL